jgi:hypothetical protein
MTSNEFKEAYAPQLAAGRAEFGGAKLQAFEAGISQILADDEVTEAEVKEFIELINLLD